MMQRRSFLAALLGAPAMDSIGSVGASQLGVPVPETQGAFSSEARPLQKAINKARGEYERRDDARRKLPQHMPDHIASRKSWSGAFKVHVYTQERMKERDLWSMDDTEILAFFAKRGIRLMDK
jgi:hypothetical protein